MRENDRWPRCRWRNHDNRSVNRLAVAAVFHHNLVGSSREGIELVAVTLIVPEQGEEDLPLFLGLDVGILSQYHAVVELELDVGVGMWRGWVDRQEGSSELSVAVPMFRFEILAAEGCHLDVEHGKSSCG